MTQRGIIFDLVGTLVYPDPPVAEVYCQVGREHGSQLDQLEVQRRFHSAFQAACWNDGGDAHHQAMWHQIVASVFELSLDRAAPLFAKLWEHFGQPSAWSVFPDVARNWPRLKERYAFLAIGSNFDGRIEPVLRGLNLWIDDAVFWSSKLNASKPDPRFFRTIERSMHVERARCLMVGDDAHDDYDGALKAGWMALLVDRRRTARSGINSVRSLDEL